MSVRCCQVVAFAALSSLCVASHARAEEVVVRFDAPAGCPAQNDFQAAVRERGANFDGAASDARVLEVKVSGTDAGFSGTLRVESAGGASDSREVRDLDCAEVVRGLAVVAAIALGAEGAAKPAATAADAVAPAEPEPTRAVPVSKPAAAGEEPTPRLRGATFPEVSRVSVPAGTLRFDTSRAATLMSGVEVGMFPGIVLPRWELKGTLANFVTTPSGESHLILPVIQLGSSLSAAGKRRFRDYETSVVAFRIGVDVCSLVSYDSEGWVFSLCADVGGGFASLRTRSLPGRPAYSQRKEAGFAYAGLALDTRYNFGSLFHVAMRVGGTGQFGSVSAERADGSQLFESNWLGGYAVAGLGVHY